MQRRGVVLHADALGKWVPQDGEWQMVLNTDDAVYEGATRDGALLDRAEIPGV